MKIVHHNATFLGNAIFFLFGSIEFGMGTRWNSFDYLNEAGYLSLTFGFFSIGIDLDF